MKVDINIDSMVVEGISRLDSRVFAQSFKQEMSRLVRENGTQGISSAAVIDAGSVHLAGNKNTGLIGEHVARTIYRSLRKK
jgi:hypothetical protein